MNDVVLNTGRVLPYYVVDQFHFWMEANEKYDGKYPTTFAYNVGDDFVELTPEEVRDLKIKTGYGDTN